MADPRCSVCGRSLQTEGEIETGICLDCQRGDAPPTRRAPVTVAKAVKSAKVEARSAARRYVISRVTALVGWVVLLLSFLAAFLLGTPGELENVVEAIIVLVGGTVGGVALLALGRAVNLLARVEHHLARLVREGEKGKGKPS